MSPNKKFWLTHRLGERGNVSDLAGGIGAVAGDVALPVEDAVLAPDLDAGLVAPVPALGEAQRDDVVLARAPHLHGDVGLHVGLLPGGCDAKAEDVSDPLACVVGCRYRVGK